MHLITHQEYLKLTCPCQEVDHNFCSKLHSKVKLDPKTTNEAGKIARINSLLKSILCPISTLERP